MSTLEIVKFPKEKAGFQDFVKRLDEIVKTKFCALPNQDYKPNTDYEKCENCYDLANQIHNNFLDVMVKENRHHLITVGKPLEGLEAYYYIKLMPNQKDKLPADLKYLDKNINWVSDEDIRELTQNEVEYEINYNDRHKCSTVLYDTSDFVPINIILDTMVMLKKYKNYYKHVMDVMMHLYYRAYTSKDLPNNLKDFINNSTILNRCGKTFFNGVKKLEHNKLEFSLSPGLTIKYPKENMDFNKFVNVLTTKIPEIEESDSKNYYDFSDSLYKLLTEQIAKHMYNKGKGQLVDQFMSLKDRAYYFVRFEVYSLDRLPSDFQYLNHKYNFFDAWVTNEDILRFQMRGIKLQLIKHCTYNMCEYEDPDCTALDKFVDAMHELDKDLTYRKHVRDVMRNLCGIAYDHLMALRSNNYSGRVPMKPNDYIIDIVLEKLKSFFVDVKMMSLNNNHVKLEFTEKAEE